MDYGNENCANQEELKVRQCSTIKITLMKKKNGSDVKETERLQCEEFLKIG